MRKFDAESELTKLTKEINGLRRSLTIQDLFHEQEIHPQLQQIETEKFGQTSSVQLIRASGIP